MAAVTIDLSIEQGATWSQAFPITDVNPPVADDWTIRSQVRSSIRSSTIRHEWSTELGNAVITIDGTITITVEPYESSAWTWRSGIYDVEVTSPDGDVVHRVFDGRVTVDPEVTR